jgi:hypothetical protein
MTAALAIPAGGRQVTRCCVAHIPGGCCDPTDCGPCCAECVTCPTVQAWTPEERAEHARWNREWMTRFCAKSVRVHAAIRRAFFVDELDVVAERIGVLGVATHHAVEVPAPPMRPDVPGLDALGCEGSLSMWFREAAS